MKCRQCKICNGQACRGEIPGLGGRDSGSSFVRNYSELRKIKVLFDVIHQDFKPDCSTIFLGKKMQLPVYVAPIGAINLNYGVDLSDEDYTKIQVNATKKVGSIAFSGDGINALEYFRKPAKVIDELGGYGILTIKPWAAKGLSARLDILNTMNYFALATDIDAAGLPILKLGSEPTELKSVEQLKELKSLTTKPLIIKGIMSVATALKAVESGAEALVISNHGGRILDDMPSTIEMLPEIVKAVKGKITILIDGGFRTGLDIFKALALGADGVLIGRPLALAAVIKGEDGVSSYLEKIKNELMEIMNLCGCRTLSDIGPQHILIADDK